MRVRYGYRGVSHHRVEVVRNPETELTLNCPLPGLFAEDFASASGCRIAASEKLRHLDPEMHYLGRSSETRHHLKLHLHGLPLAA